MKKVLTFVLIAIGLSASAFTKGDVLTVKVAIVDSVLYKYNINSGTVDPHGWSIGRSGRVIVQNEIDGDRSVVVLTNNNTGENMAPIEKFYCISNNVLKEYFHRKPGMEFGVLSVPFKFRWSPVKIMAGNTLGPYIGVLGHSMGNNAAGRIIFFGALTNVPLNDTNNKVVQTKWGFGAGTGYIISFDNDFQIGLVSGIDLFEGVEDWEYKYNPWISFSIGFKFVSTNKKDQEIALKAN